MKGFDITILGVSLSAFIINCAHLHRGGAVTICMFIISLISLIATYAITFKKYINEAKRIKSPHILIEITQDHTSYTYNIPESSIPYHASVMYHTFNDGNSAINEVNDILNN